MSAKREAGLELLRILSMLAVVVAHFLGWGTTHHAVGPIMVSFTNGGINSWIFPFAASFGPMGVICFVMITSYFICESSVLRVDRILKVWSQTLFYSVLLAFVSSVFIPVSTKSLLLSFAPVGTDQYWFVTKYVALIMLAPIMASVVRTLSHKGMVIALFVLAFLTVTITCGVPYGNRFYGDSPLSVASFVFIFFIAAYIRKYGVHPWIEKNSGTIFLAGILLQGIGGLALNFIHSDSSQVIYGGFSTGYNAFSLVPAIALFLCFKNMKVKDSAIIRFLVRLAPYTFAVYLIHDNQYFRQILWNRIFDPAEYWNSPVWLALLVVVPIAIVLICCAFDVLRSTLFKFVGVDKLIEKARKFNVTIE